MAGVVVVVAVVRVLVAGVTGACSWCRHRCWAVCVVEGPVVWVMARGVV